MNLWKTLYKIIHPFPEVGVGGGVDVQEEIRLIKPMNPSWCRFKVILSLLVPLTTHLR